MSEKLALGIYRHYKGKDYEVLQLLGIVKPKKSLSCIA